MKRLLTGFCALALGVGLLTACSEGPSDRVGGRPGGERSPSASPPSTTTPPSSTTTPGGSGSTSSPSGSPSTPGTGTK
jgi:hypothetical protein